ncbi:MAG: tetratricopeptide repeat protein [Gammaproteobacteria bacterium]
MFFSNCGFQTPTCGEFSNSWGTQSPEHMSAVNGAEPANKQSDSYWKRAKKPVTALPATIASITLLALMATQPVQSAEISPENKPAQAEVLDFAGQLAEIVKNSIGSKCDQLAGDPEDPLKTGPGMPFGQLDSAAAIEACKKAIEVSPLARYQYQLGRGSDKAEKYTEALDWYRKAADQGYAYAENALAGMYERGRGFLQQDYAEAMKWYRMAADQGDARGRHSVGLMYRDHKGVPQDNEEASKWFRLAAAQGHGVQYMH